MKKVKPLYICAAISLLMVLGGWMWESFFYEKCNWLSFLGALIWWAPGALILGIFVEGPAIIHVDLWINLTPIVSFVFWTFVLYWIIKGFVYVRKRFFSKAKAAA